VSREKGDVRAFDRLIIETTGLADPAPVIQAIMTFPVARRFRLAQVVTTIDAINGASTLARHPESVKQAAVADELVITKTDLTKEDPACSQLIEALRAFNPGARVHLSSAQRPTMPADLANVDIYDPATKSEDVARWLNLAAHEEHDHGQHHRHRHDINRHSAEIGSFVFAFDEPLHWEHVANWLDALVMGHGPDLLRVKGILDIVGRNRPVVVQAVQSLFHPPFELPAWPPGPHKSNIVFITRNLDRAFVAEVFDTIRRRTPAGLEDGRA
jgi:G3E family GTPase